MQFSLYVSFQKKCESNLAGNFYSLKANCKDNKFNGIPGVSEASCTLKQVDTQRTKNPTACKNFCVGQQRNIF